MASAWSIPSTRSRALGRHSGVAPHASRGPRDAVAQDMRRGGRRTLLRWVGDPARCGSTWTCSGSASRRGPGGGRLPAGAAAVRARGDRSRRVAPAAARGETARREARDAHRPGCRARRGLGHDAAHRGAPPSAAAEGPPGGDPPSLTFRLEDFQFRLPELPVKAKPAAAEGPSRWSGARRRRSACSKGAASRTGRSSLEGPDWVTRNPVTDSAPQPAEPAPRPRADDQEDPERGR